MSDVFKRLGESDDIDDSDVLEAFGILPGSNPSQEPAERTQEPRNVPVDTQEAECPTCNGKRYIIGPDGLAVDCPECVD